MIQLAANQKQEANPAEDRVDAAMLKSLCPQPYPQQHPYPRCSRKSQLAEHSPRSPVPRSQLAVVRASSKQQAASSKQQASSSKQQAASSQQQAARSSQQEAASRKQQAAGSSQQEAASSSQQQAARSPTEFVNYHPKQYS